MAKIFYGEVELSGYDLPHLIFANSEKEAEKSLKELVVQNKIGNGYAKVKNIKPVTGSPMIENVYRLRETTILK